MVRDAHFAQGRVKLEPVESVAAVRLEAKR